MSVALGRVIFSNRAWALLSKISFLRLRSRAPSLLLENWTGDSGAGFLAGADIAWQDQFEIWRFYVFWDVFRRAFRRQILEDQSFDSRECK